MPPTDARQPRRNAGYTRVRLSLIYTPLPIFQAFSEKRPRFFPADGMDRGRPLRGKQSGGMLRSPFCEAERKLQKRRLILKTTKITIVMITIPLCRNACRALRKNRAKDERKRRRMSRKNARESGSGFVRITLTYTLPPIFQAGPEKETVLFSRCAADASGRAERGDCSCGSPHLFENAGGDRTAARCADSRSKRFWTCRGS